LKARGEKESQLHGGRVCAISKNFLSFCGTRPFFVVISPEQQMLFCCIISRVHRKQMGLNLVNPHHPLAICLKLGISKPSLNVCSGTASSRTGAKRLFATV